MQSQPTQKCDNCHNNFPQSKIATHFGYCRRNIKKCDQCGQMVDINYKQQHEEEFHKKQPCQYCKTIFSTQELKSHQNKCDKKPKYCQYCDLNVPPSTYAVHLKQCQSRTKPCTRCDKPISNKEYLVHIVGCPGKVQQPKVPKNYGEYISRQQIKNEERKIINKPKSYQPEISSNSQIPPPRVHEKTYAPISNDRKPGVVYQNVHPSQKRQQSLSNKQVNQKQKYQEKHYITRNQQQKILKRQQLKPSNKMDPPRPQIKFIHNQPSTQSQDVRYHREQPRQPMQIPKPSQYSYKAGQIKKQQFNKPINGVKYYQNPTHQPKYQQNNIRNQPPNNERKINSNGYKQPVANLRQHNINKNISNKQIYANHQIKTVKDSKSIDRVIYPTRKQQKKKQPEFNYHQYMNNANNFNYHEQLTASQLVGGQDPELQKAIMESIMKDIENQKLIEQDIRRKHRR